MSMYGLVAPVFDKFHKFAAGGLVIAEVGSFFSDNRLQQVGLLLAGALTWLSHFLWDQTRQRREAAEADRRAREQREEWERRSRERDRESRRRDGILDALSERMRSDIKEGKPLPYPDLAHMVLSPDEIGVAEKSAEAPEKPAE